MKTLIAIATVMLVSMTVSVSTPHAASADKDALAQCYDEIGSNGSRLDIAPCLKKKQHEANLELTKALNKVRTDIQSTGSSAADNALRSLDLAHQTFELFRNIECQRVGDAVMGGSGAGDSQSGCAVDLTRWWTKKIQSQ